MLAMAQAITQAATEAAKVVVKVMPEAIETGPSSRQRNEVGGMGPQAGQLLPKQPTFHWTVKVKYTKLKDFETELTNIFMTNIYSISDWEKQTVMKLLLGIEGLQL